MYIYKEPFELAFSFLATSLMYTKLALLRGLGGEDRGKFMGVLISL